MKKHDGTRRAGATRRTAGLVGAAALLAALCTGGPARADAIDGNWCSADGQNLQIAGPKIVTPGGSAMEGSYSRHAFSYIAPEGERDPGVAVSLILVDDYTMERFVGAAAGEGAAGERWTRCQPAVS